MAETAWTKEQGEVIAARNCNLLVAAAAGAGKTAVLVERIIRKIMADDKPVDIDRLLVVTFTNAAATEMRERIAEAVSAELEKNPDSKRAQRQLTLLNKASITTIHSFCLEVIRGNFQQIDLDPGFRIADETEATLLKMEVLQELFEDLYEQDDENKDFFSLLEAYGGNRDDEALQAMVLDLYTFTRSSPWPEKWLQEMTEKFAAAGGADFGRTPWGKVLLAAARTQLEGLIADLSRAVEIIRNSAGPEKYLPVFMNELAMLRKMATLCSSQGEAAWDDLFQALQVMSFEKLPPAGRDADKELQEQVKEIRDQTKKGLNKIRDRYFWADSAQIFTDLKALFPHLQCLSRLATSFAGKYALKKSAKSLVDFNDLEHFCLAILSAGKEEGTMVPSPIALGYREKFEEIMVDEYQDSNLVQEIILGMISKADTPSPNVFMVGDVKQSIYRFRQAKPELFLEKYNAYSLAAGSSSRKILLFKNFRSRREVIEGVNFIFQQIMSGTVGELDYTAEEALNPGAVFAPCANEEYFVGGPVEFHLVQTGEGPETAMPADGRLETEQGPGQGSGGEQDDADEESLEAEMLDSIQCEARLVARRIRELMQPGRDGKSFGVYDKNIRAYRAAAYKDIVILLRTTKNWAEVFQEELAGAGIPAFADTGSGFFRTSEIQVVLSLLQVIDNPLQDIPLLAVLRSPLVSFTSDELAELRLAKRQAPFYEALQALAQKEAEDQDLSAVRKAGRFLADLQRWQEMSLYLSTDQLLWQLYTETGYYGVAGALQGGEQRQANLRILFERARQYEETSFKGLFNFINFIDKLKSGKGDLGSAKILGENDNVVRIMSIHKSKGLEFPVVILAGCGKKFNLQDMNKKILLHQELGFGPDVVDPVLRLAYPSLPKEAIREKIKSETLSEEMRILYVALTRAREKLIISGAIADLAKALAKWSKCFRTDGNKLPAYAILNGERYLDWIGPALLGYADGQLQDIIAGNKDARGATAGCRPELNTDLWQTRMHNKSELTNAPAPADGRQEDDFLSWLAGLAEESSEPANNPGADDCLGRELWAETERKLVWEYPYAELVNIPAKVSVTEIKRRFQEESEAAHLTKIKKPLFLQEKKGLSAAETGTVMHFVMQHLDLRQSDIEGQIKGMVEKDMLTGQQAESVVPDKIRSFLDSLLGRRMLSAERIFREVPFNLEIPCREIYQTLGQDSCRQEKILLQGVIDCFFEEPDGLVLVDYKTDFIPASGMEAIAERYRTQINYYARALAMLTGKQVKEKYLYLFSNGEILRI